MKHGTSDPGGHLVPPFKTLAKAAARLGQLTGFIVLPNRDPAANYDLRFVNRDDGHLIALAIYQDRRDKRLASAEAGRPNVGYNYVFLCKKHVEKLLNIVNTWAGKSDAHPLFAIFRFVEGLFFILPEYFGDEWVTEYQGAGVYCVPAEHLIHISGLAREIGYRNE